MSQSCLFCRVASRPTRPFFVSENERLVSMPALHPINPGHLVLLPRAHFEQAEALPVDLAGELLVQAAVLGRVVMDEWDYSGFSLMLHDGPPGQPLPHVHLHVVPRRAADRLDLPKPEAIERPELTYLAQRLRSRLASCS